MKKIIALVLVLVMVLSLSTVAFAGEGYHSTGSLLNDVVTFIHNVFADDDDDVTTWTGKSLARTMFAYRDEVIENIAGAIETMANYISNYDNCFADCVSCCVEKVACVFEYVYSLKAFQE